MPDNHKENSQKQNKNEKADFPTTFSLNTANPNPNPPNKTPAK